MPRLPAHLKHLLNQKDAKPKYGNHKCSCLSKHQHDSKLEANYCNRLLAMKQHGEIRDYKIHFPFELVVQEILICTVVVDFIVYKLDHFVEVHDTKSKFTKTAAWSIKHKLFNALYPQYKYVVIQAH